VAGTVNWLPKSQNASFLFQHQQLKVSGSMVSLI